MKYTDSHGERHPLFSGLVGTLHSGEAPITGGGKGSFKPSPFKPVPNAKGKPSFKTQRKTPKLKVKKV